MINEETIQMEETKMVTEQEAWERLHEAIFKELFPQNQRPYLRIYEMIRAHTRTLHTREIQSLDHKTLIEDYRTTMKE